MRQIRDVLRLLKASGMSVRKTAVSIGISRGAVTDYETRFEAAGLTWPLPPELDDVALEQRLYPPLTAEATTWGQVGNYLKSEVDLRAV